MGGFEAEILARRILDHKTSLFVVHMVFNTYFFLELLARVLLFGCNSFFKGIDARWNMFDMFIVSTSVFDIISGKETARSARLLRSVRVIRIVRTVRLFRYLSHVREFQKMVYAVCLSFKTLACSLTILLFILYFFAILFTHGFIEAHQHFIETSNPKVDELQKYWGTFLTALYSCFISVSAGQSWYLVIAPLSHYSEYLTIAFIMFINVTLFGVLNAITAIFVESAMMSAQHYKELIILDTEHKKDLSVKHIRAVFQQIDEDGSGEITKAEMERFLSHESLRKYMEALDISPDDTRMLVRLLDRDGSGRVNVDEFCDGCLKLKGEARALDMQVLLFQVKAFMDKYSDFAVYVSEVLSKIDDSLNQSAAAWCRQTSGSSMT